VSNPPPPPIDLRVVARQALLDRGINIDFPASAVIEARAALEPHYTKLGVRDLTNWLWSSIDNDDSRDLDQIEYLDISNPGKRILYVAIADVEHFVKKGSALDKYAATNTCSIYTGVQVFPMLPNELSTDLTSLNEGKTRLAVVTESHISEEGRVIASTVFPAIVKNKARLAYDAVAAWLDGETPGRDPTSTIEKLSTNQALQEQIRAQENVAVVMRKHRESLGALDFVSPQLRATTTPDGKVEVGAQYSNRATVIIQEFMIATNEAVDQFLQETKLPSIQRIVREPKNWPRMAEIASAHGTTLPAKPDGKALQEFLAVQRKRDPANFPELSLAMIKLLGRGEYVVKTQNRESLGHFGLAAPNYAHSTAPNRRYPDLITQRMLKAAFAHQDSPYTLEDLDAIAQRCSAKEDDSNRIERQVQKSVAALALQERIGDIFPALVTGVNGDGTWVRVVDPPVEGRLQSDQLFKVGDHLKARLVKTNPMRGFLDFEVAV
jgi:exoribonuclease II